MCTKIAPCRSRVLLSSVGSSHWRQEGGMHGFCQWMSQPSGDGAGLLKRSALYSWETLLPLAQVDMMPTTSLLWAAQSHYIWHEGSSSERWLLHWWLNCKRMTFQLRRWYALTTQAQGAARLGQTFPAHAPLLMPGPVQQSHISVFYFPICNSPSSHFLIFQLNIKVQQTQACPPPPSHLWHPSKISMTQPDLNGWCTEVKA